MSLVVKQTSAARIVRCVRPTEADIDRFVHEFHLHPLDAEGLLRVPEHSAVDRFRDYCLLTWCLPWPAKNGPVMIDLRFILGPKMFMVIGDTPDESVATAIEEVTAEPIMNEGQANTIFTQVIQRVATAAAAHAQVPAPDPEAVAKLLKHAADMLHSFLEILPTMDINIDDEDRRMAALAVHRLKHAAENVKQAKEKVAVSPTAGHGAKIAAGYTLASMVVLLAVLSWH